MDKMRMESVDITDQNIDKISELFPSCITETMGENGKLKKAINFDMLRQLLSKDVSEGDEVYDFTWVGKKAALREANTPIRKTLRPEKERSVNWDTTENLYIEGDNLEALKLLQESYLGKVKMIYIDPPYNTGNDFIYNDDFKMNSDEYAEESGEIDEDGDRMVKNTDSNGRFHSDWCSMIYSRLMLARNLLADDGVIFISIDNNEVENLKKICDETFGRSNFISSMAIENNPKGRKNNIFIAESFEHCLIYSKNINFIKELIVKSPSKKFFNGMTNTEEKRIPQYDEDGIFYQSKRQVVGTNKSNPLASNSKSSRCFVIYYKPESNHLILLDEYDDKNDKWSLSNKGKELLNNDYVRYCGYNILSGTPSIPLYSKETIIKLHEENGLLFKNDGTIYEKDRDSSQQITSMLTNKKFGIDLMTESATSKMEKLFGIKGIFQNSKSVDFIKSLISLYKNDNIIILDFFSGSATTAHAVMQLNAEDGGNRKFIMVQLPEKCDEKSEAFKAGYKNICEIGEERIRRAAKKIHEDNPDAKFDDGFRVFRIDDSNMTDVYYSAEQYNQNMLANLESNIKPDRTDLDLLFGCLLEWGLPLSMPHISEDINGSHVHTYNDGDLIACFDENISEETIKAIASRKPLRVVFRDSSFKDSPSKINVAEIFKMQSPDTTIKVI